MTFAANEPLPKPPLAPPAANSRSIPSTRHLRLVARSSAWMVPFTMRREYAVDGEVSLEFGLSGRDAERVASALDRAVQHQQRQQEAFAEMPRSHIGLVMDRVHDALAAHLDIDPKSHPAWTGGQQHLVDRGGRLSRFQKKFSGFLKK
jgi:ribosomal protein L31